MEPITITAVLKPKSGFEAQLEEEIKKVSAPSKQEEGCLKYQAHRTKKADAFVLYEIWESKEALNRHSESDHYKAYRENIADIVESREVYILKTMD